MAGRSAGLRQWTHIALAVALSTLACVVEAAPPPRAPQVSQASPDATLASPLEQEALTDPAGVLAKLPDAMAAARAAKDDGELSRLYLAQANACRVRADWACQRDAGAHAAEAARRAKAPLQVVRGLIAEARGSNSLQDFRRGEQRLTQAQLILRTSPSPLLTADVFLAYSSLCNQLGKYGLSVEYANRGLAALRSVAAPAMQLRLLRNKATAYSQLGDLGGAGEALAGARALAVVVEDPKLNAEVLLVAARIAHANGDVPAQREAGNGVLAYARQLQNAQLAAQGHEVLGLAAVSAKQGRTAERELAQAQRLYRQFASPRDELRALRQLIRLKLERNADAEAASLTQRFLALEGALDTIERARISDDLEARLKYAESEISRMRLQEEAATARERERALARDKRLSSGLMMLAVFVIFVLTAFFVQQRRSNRRLGQALSLLRESESQGRELLRLSTGFVLLHDLEHRILLANPAAAVALGETPEALPGRSLLDYMVDTGWAEHAALVEAEGHGEGVLRVRTVDGERHWKVTSHRMDPDGARPYVVINAVDATAQVRQAATLREQSERDVLTGAWNRRRLEPFELEHEVEGWAVIGIDLDHFKRINDTQGHERGDRVLTGIARFLESHARAQDVLVRSGGDEFLILLPGADAEQVAALCNRLRDEAAQAPCGFTLGSAARQARESLVETIARADAAMYETRRRVRG